MEIRYYCCVLDVNRSRLSCSNCKYFIGVGVIHKKDMEISMLSENVFTAYEDNPKLASSFT